MLPSPAALSRELARAGLRTRVETSFGQDYAKTLSVWNERFQAAWPDILPLGFDQRFKRLWDYYLAYCEAGFRVGWTDVSQLAVSRN
jgi:cyclopropane-fatty-acyl-phospholipid synthase